MSESTSRTMTVRHVPPLYLPWLWLTALWPYTNAHHGCTYTYQVCDVPPLALQALLHFLYTDDFEQVEKVLLEGHASSAAAVTAAVTAASSAASPATTSAAAAACQSADVQKMAQLQAVLAAAHKYQVTPACTPRNPPTPRTYP